MADNDLTTFQIDKETLSQLKELAGADLRTATSEVRWLVAQERARRQQLTLPLTPATAEAKAE